MKSRQWLAIFMMVMLSFIPLRGVAQEATPVSGGQSNGILSVALSAEEIPNPIGHVAFERVTLAPGVEIEVGGAEEWVRASLFLIESGSLEVTPIAESALWRVDHVLGGDSEPVESGSTVMLSAGDAIYLPALLQEDAEALGSYRFSNPGQEVTSTLQIHLHAPAASEFTGLPDGMRREFVGILGSEPNLQAFAEKGGTISLQSITVESGGIIVPPDDFALTIYLVETGTARYEMVKDGKVTTELRWRANSINSVTPYEDVEQQLVNRSDDPLTVLELAIIPAE